ncbi:TPA: type II toxin-antitoxin system HicB family antitoxin [Burkholderia multivorans]|uniref:type II toxin-antitoxin system HicB family antitoxin n=1 Tax=Burkholderia multivorans TaxID=87883 RepID=UPI0006862CD6|nr:type II toxin-antitoxin system HicB family antitoxin [Burkholderia multivorans]MBJ9658410.1 type II toxin-antitoxin system HicB family antitoxin [Burkholderia multivorans]MBU9353731.1 type II toxin-antitoxin system HicB family antitoxin [Burkholderia multivorans]MBU9392958.1 type II toxin-antitoxin system HicB family antitoxin [Burkholderia multivorans]MBU9471740.1 type II toxin-antitoxin system HicB family antitoxin [Burkholderia multivorans]HDR9834421.1 type II toxin-antitoxin system HicB
MAALAAQVNFPNYGLVRTLTALPDFPEVDVEGDSYGELQAAAAQRVMARYDRSMRLIPPPTTDMSALQASEVDTGDGIWRFFDIDLTRMISSSVRIELCLPKRIVHDIDRTASGLHITRDAFVSMACEHATVRSAQHGGGRGEPVAKSLSGRR